ncbi:alpha-glucan family phosphorylase [Candidatus Oscillochloris fontis]|uniref:alpha-glucan family phosphorylase n=1 Tax=Candidatus Oscillochloris fontis TaxID=2496868 RepID=UPI00101DF802|nr:alpha-glucan family phosphorylase [Candidatus Oscillochloris fontis]
MVRLESEILFTPIPERIARLRELAYNLWWAWHPEAQDLYRELDPDLWELDYHNPVDMLRDVRQTKLEEAALNPAYLKKFDAVLRDFDAYMSTKQTWFNQHFPESKETQIAYFSAEFGIHESLPIYSGGLGILSGDHVKEASDMALPFVAVGFIYPQGYFRQRLDHSGWQFAEYNKLNFADVPAIPALDPDGREVVIEVELPGRIIYAKVYKFQVGRVSLLLMDTDIHPNSPQDRELSARLYGGDQEMRVSQELVLGIGGVRALRRLGYKPNVWHMNEGHSAFLVLELCRELVVEGMSFEAAMAQVKQHCVFTTHTPVPAGNDAFPVALIEKFFWNYWPQLNLTRDEFMAIALQEQAWGPTFAMTALALRLSDYHNGVSQLHGHVARGMWQWLYPGKSQDEVPIVGITNGVHSASWLAPSIRQLFNSYLGKNWEDSLDDAEMWKKIYQVPDEVLWNTRQALKKDLIDFARTRLIQYYRRLGQPATVWPVLEEGILTIGFARRFATYKRATLIFKDMERLKAILNNPSRPVQIIFAGKAHPKDDPGKHFIQHVYQLAMQPGLTGRIIFLEEYDMAVGRALTQGVDVWLNNPRRPHEASGTSGMKASLNGAPNCSILDGWWPEAFNGKNGWAIGDEREYDDQDRQDWDDAQSLYQILEHEIVPRFYDNRNEAGVPVAWVQTCKEAIATCAPQFSFRRMLAEYVQRLYMPAARS